MIFTPDPLTPACRLHAFREHLPGDDRSIYWLYATKGPEQPEVMFNRGCHDMTKSHLHQVHLRALGYSVKVDPETYPLPFLEKPEQQCLHDRFRIHTTPVTPQPGMVYERLLDNTNELRYFYCRTGEDFAILKTRKTNDFMSYQVVKIYIAPAQRIRSVVHRFADEFGLDFAELDILEDAQGQVYITDVNNVAGTGMGIDKFAEKRLFHQLNDLYREQVKSLDL